MSPVCLLLAHAGAFVIRAPFLSHHAGAHTPRCGAAEVAAAARVDAALGSPSSKTRRAPSGF